GRGTGQQRQGRTQRTARFRGAIPGHNNGAVAVQAPRRRWNHQYGRAGTDRQLAGERRSPLTQWIAAADNGDIAEIGELQQLLDRVAVQLDPGPTDVLIPEVRFYPRFQVVSPFLENRDEL